METTTISFRGFKTLRSWLGYASNAFESEGELLRLIVTKAAIEEATQSKASRLLDGLLGGKRERIGVGNTAVYGVRLPAHIAELARECAARRGKTTSEWCATVLLSWYHGFRELYDEEHQGDNTWLVRFATQYRALIANLGTIYAQKQAKQGAAAANS